MNRGVGLCQPIAVGDNIQRRQLTDGGDEFVLIVLNTNECGRLPSITLFTRPGVNLTFRTITEVTI